MKALGMDVSSAEDKLATDLFNLQAQKKALALNVVKSLTTLR